MNNEIVVLNNFPEAFINDVSEYWHKNKNSLSYRKHIANIKHNGKVHEKLFKDIILEEKNELRDKFNDIFETPYLDKNIGYLVTPANYGHNFWHIDENRLSAINIPVEVDIYNSMFYTGYDGLDLSKNEWSDIHLGKTEFEYKPENYRFYNMRKPIVLDAKRPHAFANWANTERVLFSMNFSCTYNELLQIIPEEWL